MMKTGIIGGSGLYAMDGLTQKKWVTVATPFGRPSDQYLTGNLAGHEIVFLPRHGRGHRILPSELNHRANLYGLKKLGVTQVISVSAVGSLQKKYKPGQIVVIDQFFDRTKQSRNFTFFGAGVVAHVSFADPICGNLRKRLVAGGRQAGATVHDGGTYVNMEGPAFSTRAESRFHRAQGWDVIGMTNLGEAHCAREAELCYATLAMITDYDCWHVSAETVTVEMIIDCLQKNSQMAQEIIRLVVANPPVAAECACQNALANAIMTQPRFIPPAQRRKLNLLIGKYLPKRQ